MKNRFLLFFFVVLLSLFPLVIHAQYQVLHGTFVGGGGVRSGGGYMCYDTAGQPVIGVVSGASNTAKAGFWYCSAISSTVDVAFASFFGELKDDAALLSWSASTSISIDGFNVHRSDDSGETFVKINGALIPRESGNSYRDETILAGMSYLYRIGAVSMEKEWYSQNVSLVVPPKPTTLYQNFPNPFNPSTRIAFYLESPEHVSLVIYDVNGSVVRTLIDGARPAGRHTALWNGSNEGGRRIASGVYYYRLTAGKRSFTKKLVVVR